MRPAKQFKDQAKRHDKSGGDDRRRLVGEAFFSIELSEPPSLAFFKLRDPLIRDRRG
jgi:hypothetical protein